MKANVTALINNERTPFAETDRAWLEQLGDERLAKLSDAVSSKPESQVAPKVNAWDEVARELGVDANDARSVIANSVKKEQARRAELLEALKANARCKLSEAALAGMPTDDLEALRETLEPEDYSARRPPTANADEAEVLAIPSMEAN